MTTKLERLNFVSLCKQSIAMTEAFVKLCGNGNASFTFC